ncbi:carbamoyltransferase [Fulvivirgaceae bacterium BMA12]|uniref:Carbamoyltransferase n=1 Tax=Agaribacillus aureus TaxID=3051825 RepID=A0ABT8LI91_9BACT|nr:carbamoyltransferase [Fulvivirgaceae bacterium BMA12]
MSFNIIGISAFYHDSACCILKDGILEAAVQEERFTRRKNESALPKQAFLYCLEEAKISINHIDCIAYYEDPVKKFARQLWSGMDIITSETIHDFNPNQVEQQLREELGYKGLIKFYEHHMSHAASSFFYSGFKEAAILTIDGVGEWATTTYGLGTGNRIELFEEVSFPDSLGLLYSTITNYLGFKVNSGEYKVMGLAPYGKPIYADKVRTLITSENTGHYRLNLKYFDFMQGERMYSDELIELFGLPPRIHESEITQEHKDIAKSLQIVLEEVLLEKAQYLHQKTGARNLCMAGGVALNCVANGNILRKGPFERMFVQPAANDAGCSLGAAALAYIDLSNNDMKRPLTHVYLGPQFGANSIERLLQSTSLKYTDYRGNTNELMHITAKKLAAGKVIGWYNGRMEFGPRSLGARSILADPRDPAMRDRINAMVKKREAFRPFAPAVLESRMQEHFDLNHPSRFMLETCQVISSLYLPAITHVDGSARVQTVSRETNARFADLLTAFDNITGCPILLNTSFNVRNEPIVNSPEDALACFINTDIDCLILEDFFIDIANNDLSMLEMIQQNFINAQEENAISVSVYTFI